AFFDRYLRGNRATPSPPRVRLEVRESRRRVVEVREEDDWPPAATDWRSLHLAAGGRLLPAPPGAPGHITFHTRRTAAAFTYTFGEDTELTGPMALRTWLSVGRGDDV